MEYISRREAIRSIAIIWLTPYDFYSQELSAQHNSLTKAIKFVFAVDGLSKDTAACVM